MRAAARANVEQASKCRRGSRPTTRDGECRRTWRSERNSTRSPTGVMTVARMALNSVEQGKPALVPDTVNGEPARDRHRPRQVADGSVVASKGL